MIRAGAHPLSRRRSPGFSILGIVALLTVALLAACNDEADDQAVTPADPVGTPETVAVTPTPEVEPTPQEVTPVDDEAPSEYQLVATIDDWEDVLRPVGPLTIDDSGTVFVLTERSVHRFDGNGEFQQQIGEGFGSLPGQFRNPRDLARDASGNLYVLDAGNERVQQFSGEGEFLADWALVVPGEPEPFDPLALAIDSRDRVYLVDARSRSVLVFSNSGEYLSSWGAQGDEPGEFESPVAVTAGRFQLPDADELELILVADAFFGDIQIFTTEGDVLGTFGGFGSEPGEFEEPWDIAVDDAGNVLVVDRGNHRVQRFELDLVNGPDDVTEVEARFAAAWGERGMFQDEFELPGGIFVGPDGRIYIADEVNGIQVFDPDGEFMTGWDTTRERLLRPSGIATDDDHIYVANTGQSSIVSFDNQHISIESIRHADFRLPFAVALDDTGHLWVADVGLRGEVLLFASDGQIVDFWDHEGQLGTPSDLTIDDSGRIYVVDRTSDRVFVLSFEDGRIELETEWGASGAAAGEFNLPMGVASFDGEVYITDSHNHRVQVFDTNGNLLRVWGQPGSRHGEFDQPSGIAIDHDGHVYIADTLNNRIQKFTADGDFVTAFGEFGDQPGQFDRPFGVAMAASGFIYVADTGNHRVQVFEQGS